jgi:hypothetical protein
MKNLLRFMIGLCLVAMISGNEECSPPASLLVVNNYPECLSASNRTYGLEYDYMSGYDATIDMYKIDGTFNDAKVTIVKRYSDLNNYQTFDCQGDRHKRDSMLIRYVNDHYDRLFDTTIHGYYASIDRVTGDINDDIGGIVFKDGTYNPGFTYTGKCYEAQPVYTTVYAAGVTVHELVHQIAVTGHGGHANNNENCCIIKSSYPSGYCQTNYITLCDNHRCVVNTAVWPRP